MQVLSTFKSLPRFKQRSPFSFQWGIMTSTQKAFEKKDLALAVATCTSTGLPSTYSRLDPTATLPVACDSLLSHYSKMGMEEVHLVLPSYEGIG